jgi:hypothetical protein
MCLGVFLFGYLEANESKSGISILPKLANNYGLTVLANTLLLYYYTILLLILFNSGLPFIV